MTVELRRAADRFVTAGAGILTRHSFSFGRHFDPGNVGFGVLVAHNDDMLEPAAGYPTHPHREVEIVTWVLDGALVHRDSTGRGGVIGPGLAQRLSAGRGVRHAEFNDSAGSPLRFVQMWLPPDTAGGDPSYQQRDVAAALAAGDLVVVASGMRRHREVTAITLRQHGAAMWVAQLRTGATVTMPSAPYVHAFAAGGAVEVEGVGTLGDGDALRLTDEGGRRVVAETATDLVVWEMHTAPPPAGAAGR